MPHWKKRGKFQVGASCAIVVIGGVERWVHWRLETKRRMDMRENVEWGRDRRRVLSRKPSHIKSYKTDQICYLRCDARMGTYSKLLESQVSSSIYTSVQISFSGRDGRMSTCNAYCTTGETAKLKRTNANAFHQWRGWWEISGYVWGEATAPQKSKMKKNYPSTKTCNGTESRHTKWHWIIRKYVWHDVKRVFWIRLRMECQNWQENMGRQKCATWWRLQTA